MCVVHGRAQSAGSALACECGRPSPLATRGARDCRPLWGGCLSVELPNSGPVIALARHVRCGRRRAGWVPPGSGFVVRPPSLGALNGGGRCGGSRIPGLLPPRRSRGSSRRGPAPCPRSRERPPGAMQRKSRMATSGWCLRHTVTASSPAAASHGTAIPSRSSKARTARRTTGESSASSTRRPIVGLPGSRRHAAPRRGVTRLRPIPPRARAAYSVPQELCRQ